MNVVLVNAAPVGNDFFPGECPVPSLLVVCNYSARLASLPAVGDATRVRDWGSVGEMRLSA